MQIVTRLRLSCRQPWVSAAAVLKCPFLRLRRRRTPSLGAAVHYLCTRQDAYRARRALQTAARRRHAPFSTQWRAARPTLTRCRRRWATGSHGRARRCSVVPPMTGRLPEPAVQVMQAAERSAAAASEPFLDGVFAAAEHPARSVTVLPIGQSPVFASEAEWFDVCFHEENH